MSNNIFVFSLFCADNNKKKDGIIYSLIFVYNIVFAIFTENILWVYYCLYLNDVYKNILCVTDINWFSIHMYEYWYRYNNSYC